MQSLPFDLASIRSQYDQGAEPIDIIRLALDRVAGDGRDDVWISVGARDVLEAKARALHLTDRPKLPLWGIPFSVKDNIDAIGFETTAACPQFAYAPSKSATVVARLEAAGAICIGKTNLDQFATGLNGTRSPYGACGSAFDRNMVAGGSSSGSAVSVALHQASFSIGTDTGGSGRIPAGLNNVVGLKPTVGVLSNEGLVPNCRSLDCPSVFALTVEDAAMVAEVMRSSDPADPTLRDRVEDASFAPVLPDTARLLVPDAGQREFFGNSDGAALFEAAIQTLGTLGLPPQAMDFHPFLEAGALVFDGPWICDRNASIGTFISSHPGAVMEPVRQVLSHAERWSGTETFRAMERLRQLRAHVRTLLGLDGVLIVPTVAPLYSIAQMQQEPVARNTHHGHYSYYVNPLDLCAVAIPAGFHPSGMPFGITLIAPAFADGRLAGLASRIAAGFNIIPGKARPC